MKSSAALLFLSALAVAFAAPAAAQPGACTLTQVTAAPGHDSFAGGLSADGRFLALTSSADLAGANADHSRELFLFDRTEDALVQLTDLAAGYVHEPVLTDDGGRVFYRSSFDPELREIAPDGEVLVEHDLATGDRTVRARAVLDAAVSADGGRAAILSRDDPTGGNPDGNAEIFLVDLGTGVLIQVTDTVRVPCSGLAPRCPSHLEPRLDADGSHLVFFSDYDLDASGAEASHGGVFVYDVAGASLARVTANADPYLVVSGDASTVAFASHENLTGEPRQGTWRELFLRRSAAAGFTRVPGNRRFLNQPEALDRTGRLLAFTAAPEAGKGRDAFLFDAESGVVVPLLASPGVDDFVTDLTPDGAWAALHSKANLAGGNADGGFEVFLAECASGAVPQPPSDEWLTSSAVPGFRFQVRITAGGETQATRLESACIPETACISGALPGRSELFIRVVGPKPNGKLWPTLVRFSTSRVEVWIEQESTGDVKYYLLPGASPGSSDLTGLFDREAFVP